MLLSSIERSGAIAWSPLSNKPNYLAIGGTGGVLDQNFNTSAHLEVFELEFTEGKENLKSVGEVSAADRFTKLIWGVTGVQNGTFPCGLIVGGLANGGIHIWNPAKLLAENKEDVFVTKIEKNASSIQGLEFNPFVHNLLASGNAESEIFIYDISNTNTPTVYTPGNSQRTQSTGITSVVWNRKVQHILASSSLSGVTVIWDLKAKKPVLEFSDPNKKLQSRAIAWNPEEATQIITASSDDSVPVIQIWDLRNTYTPTKVLEGHQKGIWALSWCPMDTDLLVSTAKDHRTICWNMKTCEPLCDIEQSSSVSWNNEIQWSPRIPAVLCASSLEGKVKIFSVQDIQNKAPATASNSIPGVTSKSTTGTAFHAPKWLKRPIRASFGFGGKLVSFRKTKANEVRSVKILQLEIDSKEAERAAKFQEFVENGDLKSFCQQKLESTESEEEKAVWNLLQILCSSEALRPSLLKYLGFNSQEIAEKLGQFISAHSNKDSPNESKSEEEEEIKEPREEETIESLFAKVQMEEDSIFENVVKEAKKKPLRSLPPKDDSPIHYNFNDSEGMITQALIVGNLESAVDFCISNGKMAEALVLAAYGGSELWNYTQEAFFRSQSNSHFTKIVAVVVKEELKELIERADLEQWKITLAILCTYAKTDEFALLCNLLGNKLSEKGDELSALLCFICAGHIDRFIQIWEKKNKSPSISNLVDLIEQVTLLRKALKHKQPLSDQVTSKYGEYAQFLASQGKLDTAIRSLSFLQETKYEDTSSYAFVVLERLYHALGLNLTPPPLPYKREEVQVPGFRPPQSQPVPKQQQSTSQPQVSSPLKSQSSVSSPQTKTFNPSPVRMASPGGPTMIPPPSISFGGIPPPGFITTPSPMTGVSSSSSSHTAPSFTNVAPPPSLGSVVPPPSLGPVAPPPSLGSVAPPPSLGPVAPPPSLGSVVPPPSIGNFVPPPIITNVPFAQIPGVTPKVTSLPSSSSSSISPPPTKPIHSPPPPPTTPIGPPPTNVNPPSGKSPVQSKPSQDYSSQDTQKIIDAFNSIIDFYSQSTNEKILKYIPDVKKRLPLLYDKFSSNSLSGEVIQQFDELAQAILSKNVTLSQNLLQNITKSSWNDIGTAPMVGVKRLVEFLTL